MNGDRWMRVLLITLFVQILINPVRKLWKLINFDHVSKVSTLRRTITGQPVVSAASCKKNVRRTNKGWTKFGRPKVYWIFVLFIGILERIRTGDPFTQIPSLASFSDHIILLLSVIHWSRHKFLIKAFSLSEVCCKDTNWQNEELSWSIEVPTIPCFVRKKKEKTFLLISNFEASAY